MLPKPQKEKYHEILDGDIHDKMPKILGLFRYYHNRRIFFHAFPPKFVYDHFRSR